MSMLKSTQFVIFGVFLMQMVPADRPACAAVTARVPKSAVSVTLKSQAIPVRVFVLTQAISGGRISADPTKAPATTFAQDDTARFNTLVNDDQPGGFLDTALKAANLHQPINFDPKAMDTRLVTLKRSLSAYPQSSDVFAISLTWDSQDEAQSIVDAVQRQYITVVSGHETLIILDQNRLENLNKLELASIQYMADNGFHYPTLADQKTLQKQLIPYLVGSNNPTQKGGPECFIQPGQSAPYGTNSSLSDQPIAKVKDPAKIILFYETVPDKDGKRYVGYADGDCKVIVAADWDAARKTSGI